MTSSHESEERISLEESSIATEASPSSSEWVKIEVNDRNDCDYLNLIDPEHGPYASMPYRLL